MLLCDTLHLVGFKIFDRKKVEEEKKKENKVRLLGFDTTKKFSNKEDSEGQVLIKQNTQSPVKNKRDHEPSSPDKLEKFGKNKDKIMVPSFLDGFTMLSEDDIEILADFEEEQRRIGHFELLFPTRETIDTLGPYFDCQRHVNQVLWQYIRQKQPI
jgi:hypothetical protein